MWKEAIENTHAMLIIPQGRKKRRECVETLVRMDQFNLSSNLSPSQQDEKKKPNLIHIYAAGKTLEKNI